MDDSYFMSFAIEEAEKSRESDGYNVGVIILDKNGGIIAGAHSDETQDKGHAEELAIASISDSRQLEGATMYTTMEPCSYRPSGRVPCCSLTIAAGIKRVVYGTRDPGHITRGNFNSKEETIISPCRGIERLVEFGIEVVHLQEFEEACRALSPQLFH